MNEVGLFLGLATVIAFLIAVAIRLGSLATKRYEQGKEDEGFMLRVAELFTYALSAIVVSQVLFLLKELTAAEGYGGILTMLFIIFQYILGIVGGFGSIVFGVLTVLNFIKSIKIK